MNVLNWLVETSPLTPHGFCLFWDPVILWIDAGSDGATMLAYFSIPLALFWFARRRTDLPHRWIAGLFVCFIVACGVTHAFSILTLWVPAYRQEAAAKLLTACLSIGTAITLWPLVPKLLALPSPREMAGLNEELRNSLAEQERIATRLRDSEKSLLQTQEILRHNNELLEQRVAERTAELRRERESLRIANERLSLATQSGGIGVWDWNIVTTEMVWDANIYAMLDVEPDRPPAIELWQSAVHPDDRAATAQDLQDAVTSAQSLDSEFRVVWRDGTTHNVHAAGRVTRDEAGRAVRLVGVFWDVTERHAADAMRLARDAADRASRAKSDFLATMSHEIRSPLSGLIGVVDLLRGTALDSEQSRMVAMVHGSASMLLAVLNDILDFSKIEAGAVSIALEPIALRRFIDDLVQPHAVTAGRRGLRLGVAVEPDLPDAITCDPLRLQQMLGNLLGNAIKFTTTGEVNFTVGMEHLTDGPMLRFAVRDSGIGMTEAVLGRLFRPFTQADGSTTRNYGGTGLGLSISKKLAQLLGGDISATSTPGVGSQFVLHLPLIRADLVPQALDEMPQSPGLGQAWRVLLVDDDPTIRWLTQRQLEKLGVAVDHAPDGAAGLQKLVAGHYDIVLTDCHMPNMDGVALTRTIRALPDLVLSRMPVIGLTADVTEAQRLRCVDAGMAELAIKPLTVESLSQLLVRHLSALAPSIPPIAAAEKLQSVVFDEQLYLAVFEPGDQEGAAWLREYLDVARQDFQKLETIAQAATEAKTSLIAPLAHRLAGASFSAGAVLLGEAARAVELAALGNDTIAVQNALVALAAAHQAAEAAILAFLAQHAHLPTCGAG